MRVCACVHACVRVCMRACVCVCVCERARARARERERERERERVCVPKVKSLFPPPPRPPPSCSVGLLQAKKEGDANRWVMFVFSDRTPGPAQRLAETQRQSDVGAERTVRHWSAASTPPLLPADVRWVKLPPPPHLTPAPSS